MGQLMFGHGANGISAGGGGNSGALALKSNHINYHSRGTVTL